MAEEKQEARTWTEVESLKGTRFGALLVDYRELKTQEEDLKARLEAIRELIAEHAPSLSSPVLVENQWVKWHLESQLPDKLDRKLLVQAGVTPDQLAKGTVPGSKKKAYLEIRTISQN